MKDPNTNNGSGCATFIIWCLPSAITPVVQFMCFNVWPLGLAANLGIVISFGFAWAKTASYLTHDNTGPLLHRMWVRVTVFTLAQFLIIPIFIYTTIYGFCMITGLEDFH